MTLHESTTTRVYEKVMDKGPELVDQIMEMLKKNKDDKDNHEERNVVNHQSRLQRPLPS